MSELGWRADGIERAVTAGGVELERYRRPGFTGGTAVRRSDANGGGSGVPIDYGERWDHEPDPDLRQFAEKRRQ